MFTECLYIQVSMHISSGYIVFVFLELLSHGRDRLVIALTRYDEVLNCVRGEQPVTLDEIQRDICECVKDVTNGQQELLPASILPVSGRWALACSSLSNCLGILDEKEDEFIERY